MDINAIYFGFVIGLINAMIICYVVCRIDYLKKEIESLERELSRRRRTGNKDFISLIRFKKMVKEKILTNKDEAKEMIKYYLDVLVEDCEGEE